MSQIEIVRVPAPVDFDHDISRSAPVRNFHHPYNSHHHGFNPISHAGRGGGVKVARRNRTWSNANAYAIPAPTPKVDLSATFLQEIFAASPICVTADCIPVPSILQQRLLGEHSSVPACAPIHEAPVPATLTSAATATEKEQAKPSLDHVNPEHPFASVGLTALLRGSSDVHLRAGIDAASRAAEEGVVDAEKAFFVADLSVVYEQHERWMTALPEVQPFYAVKCNPDPYVIRLLAALGTGFDCASNNEIKQVVDTLNSSPSSANTSVSDRIIFANPCKPLTFLRGAQRAGVDMMTFDNADELDKIARTYPKARLVIRILTDDSQSLCQLGIKFGAPLDVVPALLKRAKELELDAIGVSFHVGSGCFDPAGAYLDAIRRAKAVFDMAKEAGFTFTLLDVGGGFEDKLFDAAASSLKVAIDECFPRRKEEGLKIIAEPGRFYVSRAFSLATNIIARRASPQRPQDTQPSPPATVVDGEEGMELDEEISEQKVTEGKDEAPAVMYYINDGVYGAFNCIIFDHQVVHPYVLSMATPASSSGSEETQSKCSIWGPTCDSIDCVCPSATLPSALRVGDWLGFRNMGAYTVCAASQFNGFEVSKVVYTVGDEGMREAREVRRVLSEFATASAGVSVGQPAVNEVEVEGACASASTGLSWDQAGL